MAGYKVFTLKNGVKVAVVSVPGLSSVTIEVLVKIGAKYEKSGEYGISHLLEHMAFKGTKKRKSAIEIHREIDGKGAVHNAGTGLEYTSYFIKTTNDNITWALELLGDILANPKLDEAELNREERVVAEEIRMYEDNPTMGLSGEFAKMMLGDTGSGCWNISGGVKDVVGINREILVDYRRRYLSAREMVVVVAGDVKNSQMADLGRWVEEYFGGFGRGEEELPAVKVGWGKQKVWRLKKNIGQAHFCLGVPTIPWRDKRRYANQVMEVMLSGNSSSRLNTVIRERGALAYYIFPVGESIKEAGYWALQAGVKIERVDEAVVMVKREINKAREWASSEFMENAKSYIVGKIMLNRDSSNYWSGVVGQKLLLENRLIELDKELDRYRKVRHGDVIELIDKFLDVGEARVMVVSK